MNSFVAQVDSHIQVVAYVEVGYTLKVAVRAIGHPQTRGEVAVTHPSPKKILKLQVTDKKYEQ